MRAYESFLVCRSAFFHCTVRDMAYIRNEEEIYGHFIRSLKQAQTDYALCYLSSSIQILFTSLANLFASFALPTSSSQPWLYYRAFRSRFSDGRFAAEETSSVTQRFYASCQVNFYFPKKNFTAFDLLL